jgi:hypothetical protein
MVVIWTYAVGCGEKRCMHARKEGRKDAWMDEVTCLYIYVYIYILIHIHTIQLCDLNVGGCVRDLFTQTKLVDVFLMNWPTPGRAALPSPYQPEDFWPQRGHKSSGQPAIMKNVGQDMSRSLVHSDRNMGYFFRMGQPSWLENGI